jgi:hypothetical protein
MRASALPISACCCEEREPKLSATNPMSMVFALAPQMQGAK